MTALSRFKQYRKKPTLFSEMRPYVPGEDLTNIYLGRTDTPEPGGMVARNPENHKELWYVPKKYFEENMEAVE